MGQPGSITESVRGFVAEQLLHGADRVEDDTDLLEVGAIDSLAVAELAAFAYERFGVRIEMEMTPGDLRTVGAIAALVERLSDGHEGP